MQYGKIKWFDPKKGYGFIKPKGGGPDVFIHRNNVENLGFDEVLEEGEDVEYILDETPKGFTAVDVRRVFDK